MCDKNIQSCQYKMYMSINLTSTSYACMSLKPYLCTEKSVQ